MIRHLLPTLLISVLFCSCNTTGETHNFKIEETGGIRYECRIDFNDYFTSILNGYTDPKLRKILQKCVSESTSTSHFFDRFEINVSDNKYDIITYFNRGNSILFPKNIEEKKVFSVLRDQYDTYVNETFAFLNTKLKNDSIIYNLYISDVKEIVLECQVIKDSSYLVNSILGKGVLHFYEVINFVEAFDYILDLDSTHFPITAQDSIVSAENFIYSEFDANLGGTINKSYPRSKLFKGKLDISYAENFYSDGTLPYYTKPISIGISDDKDTAYVSNLIQSNWNLFWEKHFWAPNMDGVNSYHLIIVRKAPIESRINSDDIAIAQSFKNNETGDFGFEFLLTDEGDRKFYHFTKNNVNRTYMIVLNNEVLTMSYVDEPYFSPVGFIGDYNKIETEHIANSLNTTSPPFKLEIISKTQVKSK